MTRGQVDRLRPVWILHYHSLVSSSLFFLSVDVAGQSTTSSPAFSSPRYCRPDPRRHHQPSFPLGMCSRSVSSVPPDDVGSGVFLLITAVRSGGFFFPSDVLHGIWSDWGSCFFGMSQDLVQRRNLEVELYM